jgi:Galactose oxidase, central domain
VAIVLIMLISGSMSGGIPAKVASATLLNGVAPVNSSSAYGQAQLAAAEASLASGGGPALGSAVLCVATIATLSANCQNAAGALTISSFTISPAFQALAYVSTISTTVTGGTTPYSYSYTGLPTPCASTNASFTCTAYYDGSYNITVKVTDATGATASATGNLLVNCTNCGTLGTPLTYGDTINPAARTQASTAYDIKDGYSVLFGGWNGTAIFGDTWSFKTGWEPLDPLTSPSARYDASMAYDKTNGYVVLFGGRNSTAYLGDTWTYVGNQWTKVTTSVAPSPRAGAAMVWDSKDNYMVLFGGYNGLSTLSDTWKFVGGTWTLIPTTPAAAPSGRSDAAFAYDGKDNYAVLFGGINQSGATSVLGDTWTYTAGTWTHLTGIAAPPARSQAVFVFDSTLNYTLLFGGANVLTSQQFQDSWEFVGGVWTELSPSYSPAPRQGAAGVWDQVDLRVMVFSGDEQGLPANIPDTWWFYSGNWAEDQSTPSFSWSQPSARVGGGIAFDTAAGYTIFFGGQTRDGANGETWAYGNQEWIEIFPTTSPSARSFPAMAYDAKDGYVVLFGGRNATGTALSDTWTFTGKVWNGHKSPTVGGNWTRLSPPTSPPSRYGAGGTYDITDGVFLIFGGIGASGTALGDTWSFTGGVWTQIVPTGASPPARAFEVLVNDAAPKDGYVVLFGGMSGTTLLSDTWTFKGGVWKNLSLAVHPNAGWGSSAVYDSLNGETILFGGCGQAVNPLLFECNRLTNETWRYLENSWALLPRDPSPLAGAEAAVVWDGSANDLYVLVNGGLVNTSQMLLSTDRWDYSGIYVQWAEPQYPSARQGQETIYDQRDQEQLTFGGFGPLPGGGVGYLNDTWEWDTYVYNLAASPGAICKGCANHHPTPRAWGAIGYDPVSSQTIYFGGRNATGYLGQTWSWSGSYTTGKWTELSPTNSPPAFTNESMAWDQVDGYMVLFGGQNATTTFGQTWTFANDSWTHVTPTVSPAVRAGASMAYDYTTHTLMLFGGWNPQTGVAYNDTWKFAAGVWTNITPKVSPTARYGAVFSDDSQDGTVFLFGGVTSKGVYLGDTWTWAHDSWVEVPASGNTPTPSAFGAAGNDESDGNVMMFGGYNGNYLGGFYVFF